MRIGYACLAIGVMNSNQKSCILKNATDSKLTELIHYNLSALEVLIDYNSKNQIKLFRISSDLIPFGSNPVNQIKWWITEADTFKRIGLKIRNNGMRVSMHPGQYTVINSPDEIIVGRAIEDLNYHARVLDSLGLDSQHKIILHIGGVYLDKPKAVQRFVESYEKLDERVKKRLVIENDDKSYTISEVLEIGYKLMIPVVFDNLHNEANPSIQKKEETEWILECQKTWKEADGPQKIHYSNQDTKKQKGSHSVTIQIDQFLKFIKVYPTNMQDDFML